MSDLHECYWCGDTEAPHKAIASRIWAGRSLTRYFCHTDERSCYNECRGDYFKVKYLGGQR